MYLCAMLRKKDISSAWWLSAFRPMLFILLPIGQCIAQDLPFKIDLVGLQRRKVQVVMKNFSFSEYKKDHVTYVLDEGVKQRINYLADTCSSIQFLVDSKSVDQFKLDLAETTNENELQMTSEIRGENMVFTVDKRLRPKDAYTDYVRKKKQKKRRSNKVPKNQEKHSFERVASDERYFEIQKKSWKNESDGVTILGWRKD
ncbi:MAG: hypothetical protein ACI9FU_001069 [Granulosicoccus sp.]|jgi:hypothetical protein